MKRNGLNIFIDGKLYDQWLSGEVSRDMKDFAGSFSFTFRDQIRSAKALPFASQGGPHKLRPGSEVVIKIGMQPILKGWIERVDPSIAEGDATVNISGRDKCADLIDCSAMKDVAEFNNVKLEDAAKRIAQPFGLTVRSEIDTGNPFDRYSLDLAESAFSAIEKGARKRHALILSDGVGGLLITRSGNKRAPAHLIQPGNVLRGGASFSHENRFSETIVRGQGERAGRQRGKSTLDSSAEPLPTERRSASGSQTNATNKERLGTVATGRAKDDDVKRYRPIVHLARSKSDTKSAQDEADWRSRTSRAESEEATLTVKGFVANGRIWTVNEITYVSNAFLDIERDMLISKVRFVEDASGRTCDLCVVSPEAFDKEPVGDRRKNKQSKTSKGVTTSNKSDLDSTAEAL